MSDPLEALRTAGLPVPANKPRQDIWNTASNGTDPALDRAVWELQKSYPSDVLDVDIKPMPMTDEYIGTNVVGETNWNPGQREQSIHVNPSITMSFPQSRVEANLAHELQHVRQNRAIPAKDASIEMLKNLSRPYEERPREIEANDTAIKYLEDRGLPKQWKADPEIFYNLPKMIK